MFSDKFVRVPRIMQQRTRLSMTTPEFGPVWLIRRAGISMISVTREPYKTEYINAQCTTAGQGDNFFFLWRGCTAKALELESVGCALQASDFNRRPWKLLRFCTRMIIGSAKGNCDIKDHSAPVLPIFSRAFWAGTSESQQEKNLLAAIMRIFTIILPLLVFVLQGALAVPIAESGELCVEYPRLFPVLL